MTRKAPWFLGVFAVAIVLHVVWAGLLLGGDDPLGATPLYTLGVVVGNKYLLILLLTTSSILAGWSLLSNMHSRWSIALLVPQQALMLVSGGGAASSVFESSYADGVIRPAGFIGADQMLIILLAVAHTLALLWIVGTEANRRG